MIAHPRPRTNNSMIMLISEQDEVSYQKQLPNDLSTILEQ